MSIDGSLTHGALLVTLLAEAQKGRIGALQLLAPLIRPKVQEIRLEPIHIIARRNLLRPFERIVGNPRKQAVLRRHRPRRARREGHLIGFPVNRDPIVGKVAMLPVLIGDRLQKPPELEIRGLRAALLLERGKVERDRLSRPATVLAGDLIEPPFKRLPKPEILPVERQNLFRSNGIEHPVRKPDFDFLHPTLARLTHDLHAVDQTENVVLFRARRQDVGFNLRPLQPLESRAQLLIAAPVRPPIGGDEQVISLEAHDLAHRLVVVQGRHKLADAVDQHIAVMDGRKSQLAGRHAHEGRAVPILARCHVGLCRNAEKRVLHRRHVPFRRSVEHIAHEKILLRIAIRQERGAAFEIRVFTHEPQAIVLSPSTPSPIRAFTHGLWISRAFAFVLSPIKFRVITHELSCYHP